jgi:rubrerythrin
MASTYQLLEKAVQVELVAEQLYRALAERFAGDAKALFRRLADEEGQHAARIRLLAARYLQDRRLMPSLDSDLSLLDRLLREAEEALGVALGGAWDGDAPAARAAAVELERRFCMVHAQVLSGDGHPELRAFFDQLALQDKAHHDLLGS